MLAELDHFSFSPFPPPLGHRMGEDEKSGEIEKLRDGSECGDEFFFVVWGFLR
jgi:hypothetical protein